MFEVLSEMYPELAEVSTSIPGTNQRATLKSLSNVKKDDIVRNYFLPRKKGFSVIDDNQPQSYLVGESVASVMKEVYLPYYKKYKDPIGAVIHRSPPDYEELQRIFQLLAIAPGSSYGIVRENREQRLFCVFCKG